MSGKPSVVITYCPGCRWLLRSAWMAQELLSTFEKELAGVTLAPSEISGAFTITVDDQLIWDRQHDGGFPDIKALKQKVRDVIAPERDLGHTDR